MSQNFCFPKDNRLLKKSDLSNLKEGSHFSGSEYLLAFYKSNQYSNTRIGFAVSKKLGNAVARNRVKRIMKEVFRQSKFKELSRDVLITFNAKRLKTIEGLDPNSLRVNLERVLSNLK